MSIQKDITGQKFNKLTAIKPNGKNKISCCKKCNLIKKSVTLNIIKKVYEHLKLENYDPIN